MMIIALGLAALLQAAEPLPWPEYGAGTPVCTPADKELLPEISGMAVSYRNPDLVWFHNDSGSDAQLHALRLSTGESLGTVTLPNIDAVDWEDIALGPGPDGHPDYLYVADFGNNGLKRKTLVIYRIPEPGVSADETDQPIKWTAERVENIVFEYPGDATYDAETLLVDPISGDLIIVTKEGGGAKGVSHVFKTPRPLRLDEINTLDHVGTIAFGKGRLDGVTAGDVSQDGRWAIVRTYREARLYRRGKEGLAQSLMGPHTTISLTPEPQGEAIAFGRSTPEGPTFFTASELGPKRFYPDQRMMPILRYQAH